jgi:hypothetical protein
VHLAEGIEADTVCLTLHWSCASRRRTIENTFIADLSSRLTVMAGRVYHAFPMVVLARVVEYKGFRSSLSRASCPVEVYTNSRWWRRWTVDTALTSKLTVTGVDASGWMSNSSSLLIDLQSILTVLTLYLPLRVCIVELSPIVSHEFG